MNRNQRKKIIKRTYPMSVILLVFLFISALALLNAGCNNEDTGIAGNTSGDNVSVGFYSENNSGDNTLEITKAKFVLRKLVLDKGHGDNGDHECDVKLGPFVVYLDLTQKVGLAALAKIPLGIYDEIKFQVHKPSPNEGISDPDFFESNSRRFSVVVKGFFNGNPFIFKSAVTVSKEIELEGQPINIGAIPIANLTIRLSPYLWFAHNGEILDPSNPANENEIDQNIKNSLRRAFRDLDINGEPD